MTEILYKRIYEIILSEPLIDPSEFKVPFLLDRESVGKTTKNYNVTLEAKQEVITGLDFSASITKDKSDSANQCDLTLLNISERAQSILEVEGAVVIIKAGFETISGKAVDTPIQFIGQVQQIEETKTPTGVTVAVKLADGIEMLKNQRITYNAPVGASVAETIKELALSFTNVVEGHFALEDIEGETFPTGFSAFGKLTDILRELVNSRKLKFSIEDNTIYVYPDSWYRLTEEKGIVPYDEVTVIPWAISDSKAKAEVVRKGVKHVFNPDTVISAKSLIERRKAKAGSGKGTSGVTLKIPTYVNFNTQLDQVELTNDFPSKVAGIYTIEAVNIELESHDGSWETTLELTSS